MLHPDDVAAWLTQVRQNPEAAPDIVEALAARLIELDRQNEALRDELVRLRRQQTVAPNSDRVIKDLKRQLEQALEVGASPRESQSAARALFVFTLDGRGARLALPAPATWQEQADSTLVAAHLRPRRLLIAREQDELLIVSDKGRVVRFPASEIAPAEPPVHYLSLLPHLPLDLDESISVVLSLGRMADLGMLTLITRKGYARSFKRAEFESLLERGLPLYSSPVEGDYLAFVLLSDGQGELLVASRGGQGVRFPERAIGVKAAAAIRLERGDVVVGATVVDDETSVLVATADGLAARREMRGLATHATAGNKGRSLIRGQGVIAVAPVVPQDTLWLLTADGRLLNAPAHRVPAGPGAAQGVRITPAGDALVALAVAPTGGERE